jgi:putative hydrolase of the HAD superfamily
VASLALVLYQGHSAGFESAASGILVGAPLSRAKYCVFSVPIDLSRIRAISLDLDDTLWPVWPAIARAEACLQQWLAEHAPAAHTLCAQPGVRQALRSQAAQGLPGQGHDMSALRQEAIRLALVQAGENPALAAPAFEVFLAERQRVDLFGDAIPALAFLSQRFPLIALSNGNADVSRMDLAHFFAGAVSAVDVGHAKPDPRMFHRAAELAGVPAHSVLHVGDDAQHDGAGARAAGMQFAWLNRAGKPWEHAEWSPNLSVATLDVLCSHFTNSPSSF